MNTLSVGFECMMAVMEFVQFGIKEIFLENNDPRTKDLFLVSSPIPLLVIMITYLFFSLYCGKTFMKNRKPFELRNTLIVYNALQVALSIYLVQGGIRSAWNGNYSFSCQPIDYSDSPIATAMNYYVWWYYFAKITELLDTVFFILRKKYDQVTFLHIYHHSIMPLFSYVGIRYYPNGHACLFGILNSFVHIIMYTYYLIAGLGPQYHKYLWWKKHVTNIQLIQFSLIFIHNFLPLFTDCAYPKHLNYLLCLESSVFLYLFGKFYVKSYLQKKEKKSDLNGNYDTTGKNKGSTNGKTKIS